MIRVLWLVAFLTCVGWVSVFFMIPGCSTLPPTQPKDVQVDCDRFMALFEQGHDAGLTCEESRVKAQAQAAKCPLLVVCKVVQDAGTE